MAVRAEKNKPAGKRILLNVAAGVGLLAVVVLLLVWLAGGFHPKIDSMAGWLASEGGAGGEGSPAGQGGPPSAGAPLPPGTATAKVTLRKVPHIETAVGTVRAVHEMALASKLLAKVVEVHVTAGQRVSAGEVLVRLDAEDLAARLAQSESAAAAARAARDQARIEFDRVKGLLERQAASQIEWDRVQSALKAAEAELQRAQQSVTESRTVLSYATIAAPIDAVVIDKRVSAGDTAAPGQVLLTLFDPTHMQLVASVRESLTQRLRVGQTIGVRIDTLGYPCDGRISEIVPEAEAASRSFLVKVTGPCPPGVYSGMFGRLLIPLDEESVLVVLRSAVRRVGQLDLVMVVQDGRMLRRAVKLGRTFDDEVEVLSGLREGEAVVESAVEGA